MKVHIGPYPRHFSSRLFQNHMNQKYGFDWPSKREYTKYELFLDRADDFINPVLWKITRLFEQERKIKVKIERSDVWDAHSTLAYIILPILQEIRKDANGSPFVDDDDVPAGLKSTDAPPLTEEQKNTGHVDALHFDRWNYVLDQMIFSFENIVDESWQEKFHTGVISRETVPQDKDGNDCDELDAVIYEWRALPDDTSQFDKEGYQEYDARIQNGLILFGKYYRSLWT